jgi:hypothetical protein
MKRQNEACDSKSNKKVRVAEAESELNSAFTKIQQQQQGSVTETNKAQQKINVLHLSESKDLNARALTFQH